jgi:hypothetical protein
MGNAIGIKVAGTNNKVYLPDFLKAGNDLMELLIEIDITTSSPTYKRTVNWRLKTLSYASPALLEVEGEIKEDQPDNRANIIDTTLRGIESLKKHSERPSGYSDKALGIAKDLTTLLQNGVKTLEIISDGSSVEYQTNIIKNVDVILTPGKQMYGSIEGRIEWMNSHEEFSFYLYEPIRYRRIRCELDEPKDLELKQKVINHFEQYVIVSGLLDTNINGEVTSAKVISVSVKEVAPLLKDASEVTGIWDLTGRDNPVEHIRRIRYGT